MTEQQNFIIKPLVLALAMGAGSLANAQDDFTLEEIVVTAQKREQSLQEVPVAVTAFSGNDLSSKGLTDLNQISRQTPNVTLEASRATNSTLTAYIRGIGQQDPLWGFEPGVGVYIDDIYFARPQAALLDVYDVERIEVLRGPQGTVYGKNTIGGAIKYVTRSIAGESGAVVDVNLGSHGQRDLKLSGSTALVEDKVWIGGAVASLNRDGYGNYVGPINAGEENGNKDLLAYRVSLEAQPSDDLSVRLSIDNTVDKSNNRGGHRLTNGFLNGDLPLDNVHDTRSGIDPTQEVNNKGASLTVAWDLNDSISLKSITASREGDTYTSIDFDNEQAEFMEAPGAVYTDEQFSQEFQLNYTGDKLSGVVGLYYFDGDATGNFDLDLFEGVYGTDANGNPLIGTRTIGAVNTKSQAIYAQGTYRFSDDWSMTLGGRYSKDEKNTESFFSDYNVLAGNGNFDNQRVVSDFERSPSWTDFSPRIGVEYYGIEDVMLFASYAKGFKSGGVDPRANLIANPSSGDPFDPEIVKTLELGAKTELWDGRVRLNATLFNNQYDDQQVTTSILIDGDGDGEAESFAGQVVNAGKASAQGFELETIALLAEQFTVNLTYGYIDATIDEFITIDPVTLEPINIADSRVVSNTPKSTANVGLTYDLTLFGGNLMLNANAAYRGAVHIFEVASDIDEDAYTLLDANIVWTSDTQKWTVGLHGKNLTDEEYRVSGYNFPTLANSVIGYYGAPRTVTLNLGYQF